VNFLNSFRKGWNHYLAQEEGNEENSREAYDNLLGGWGRRDRRRDQRRTWWGCVGRLINSLIITGLFGSGPGVTQAGVMVSGEFASESRKMELQWEHREEEESSPRACRVPHLTTIETAIRE